MSLFSHELIHLILSLLTAFIVIYISRRKKIGEKLVICMFSFFGGFFIDVDHLFDYFFSFGPRFRLDYFLKGLQFYKTGKLFVPFHSFELVFICLISISIFYLLSFIFKHPTSSIYNLVSRINHLTSIIFFSFAFALLLHLFFDIYTNKLSFKSYFFTYRLGKKFELRSLTTSDRYKNYLQIKKQIKF